MVHSWLKNNIIKLLTSILVVSGLAAAAPVQAFSKAQLQSPAGYWLTIDDKTGKPRGVVQIYLTQKGELEGKTIAGLYIKGFPWRKTCTGCVGQFANKNIQGMVFMWGYQQKANKWVGGKVFDIDSNKSIYRSSLWLTNGGQKLHLRGYILFFHRTQTWDRLTSAQVKNYKKLMQKQIKTHPQKP